MVDRVVRTMRHHAQIATVVTVVASLIAAPAASLPVQGEARANLVPGGGSPLGVTWSDYEDAQCEQAADDGQPAPSRACTTEIDATGDQYCWSEDGNGSSETECNSYVNVDRVGGTATNFTVPPLFAGRVAGWQPQHYELSFDYRLELSGNVTGSSNDVYGDLWTELEAKIVTSDGEQTVWRSDEIDDVSDYVPDCCDDSNETDRFEFDEDTGWLSTGPIRITDDAGGHPLAGHAGDQLRLVLYAECDGWADQDDGAPGQPVGIDAACTLTVDNVRLDMTVTTP